MVSEELHKQLKRRIAQAEQPSEAAVDVMYALQKAYGYLGDEALLEASHLLGMTPLELEEIATFYDFIYREPVGRYVIHVCDSITCSICGHQSVMEYLCQNLGISIGETTKDGLFTLLPVCCVGFCDHAPVMLINGELYGHLTPESIDAILQKLRQEQPPPIETR